MLPPRLKLDFWEWVGSLQREHFDEPNLSLPSQIVTNSETVVASSCHDCHTCRDGCMGMQLIRLFDLNARWYWGVYFNQQGYFKTDRQKDSATEQFKQISKEANLIMQQLEKTLPLKAGHYPFLPEPNQLNSD